MQGFVQQGCPSRALECRRQMANDFTAIFARASSKDYTSILPYQILITAVSIKVAASKLPNFNDI